MSIMAKEKTIMGHEKGAALVSVLAIVVISLVLGGALQRFTAVEATQVQTEQARSQAHYVARSGMSVALSYLNTKIDQYINEANQNGVTGGSLDLPSGFEGTIEGAGRYEVDFALDGSRVRITVRGYAGAVVEVREAIAFDIDLQPTADGYVAIDAEELGWYDDPAGGTRHLKTVQRLGGPGKAGGPVLLHTKNGIQTKGDHEFCAPLLVFQTDTLTVKNGNWLLLRSNFVSFETAISIGQEHKGSVLILCVYDDNAIARPDGNYGVVYFDRVPGKNKNHMNPAIPSPGYYLFSNGTELWEEGVHGTLIPISSEYAALLLIRLLPGSSHFRPATS